MLAGLEIAGHDYAKVAFGRGRRYCLLSMMTVDFNDTTRPIEVRVELDTLSVLLESQVEDSYIDVAILLPS